MLIQKATGLQIHIWTLKRNPNRMSIINVTKTSYYQVLSIDPSFS